ncbi:hypothetical protein H4582DRAFT_2076662 [Lactarius indigo]|nr:hypothetical protein H4582DRAFT_2076662 [Lactarius indigo]
MSRPPATATSSSRFQAIFNGALQSYQKQTKQDLTTHPLASQLQSCDSTSAILAVLQDQVREFDQAHGGDERLTKWLIPTVNVLYAFSAALSEGVGLVFSPGKAIFAGIGVFLLASILSAAKDVAASKDTLAELFKRIGFFFKRLETYTEVTPTTAMTDIITEIMVEVLIGLWYRNERAKARIRQFLKKLAGRADLEDAIKKLDWLTQEEARMALAEVLKITHTVHDNVTVVDGKVKGIDGKMNGIGDKLTQLVRAWLSPADPSTNHNIAQKAQHKGTAVWFFRDSIFFEWKSNGSLLWIHWKAWLWEKRYMFLHYSRHYGCMRSGVRPIMAYFYFDFRDLNKQTCHDLLLSLVSQLSISSSLYCGILNRMYTSHKNGARQPSDDTLKECLREMLRLPGQGPIFIVLDALDECPDSSGIPSPRDEVLQLVKELVDLDLQEASHLRDQSPGGRLSELSWSHWHFVRFPYITKVDNKPTSLTMSELSSTHLRREPDGMFRWVFCQLEALRHCFPSNLRRFLNELPETLDETYERILRGINKTKKDDARRLLQCLAVAVRPLRVEELAELLALKDDWRWDDQEEAVLSTCSSLIAVVPDGRSRVVQFSHFSVKEYLTSARLAKSQGDVSQFHVGLEPAHTILAQACLGTLLRLDEHADAEGFPLVEYAAEHWVEHARFEKVSARVQDGMDDLFDSSKPHFAAWLRVHDMDNDPPEELPYFSDYEPSAGSPLYYSAFCGFYDLSERLIVKHPEHVNPGGQVRAPLPAALFKRYFSVAELLYDHGAVVDVRGDYERTPLHAASIIGSVDMMRWLLNHGADVNARTVGRRTSLHVSAFNMHLEAVQALLEFDADINSRSDYGQTPLHDTISYDEWPPEGERIGVVRRLLEHGSDPNACNDYRSTPLHQASSMGFIEVARVLLSYGANVDEKDWWGRTPVEVASPKGRDEMRKLLLEHGAEAPPWARP